MLFKNIVGFKTIKDNLAKMVNSRQVPHSFLFLGEEGSGHFTTALAFATLLNCENPTKNDACGQCRSCRKMEKLIHPDLHLIFPITSSHKTVEKPLCKDFLVQWREFILKNSYPFLTDWLAFIDAENKQGSISREESRDIIYSMSFKSYEAEYKIQILWHPELLNPAAGNALLKLLEEPPNKTVFIWVADSTDSILPTLVSRLHIVKFPPLSGEELNDFLVKEGVDDIEKRQRLILLSDGNPGRALSFLSEGKNDQFTFFRDWLRAGFAKNFKRIFELMEDFSKLGREFQKSTLLYGIKLIRESFLVSAGAPQLNRVGGEEQDFAGKFADYISYDSLEKFCRLLEEAAFHIERNAHPKILFMDVSLKFMEILGNR